ncbi:MAG: MFS transporter [Puniceicoccales bacterium]
MSERTEQPPRRLLVLFLALLSATPPLSTDMYLAAIPHIADQWEAPISQINLSLVLWFVAFSISLLFFGALSDRVGRRPVLLGGLLAFAITSGLCALANGPVSLIIFRVLQGIAASAPSAMTMAYCRDCFTGRARQQLLAWLGIIISVAPMVAPSIGAMILRVANWRVIFAVLAIVGLIQLTLAFRYFRESAESLEKGGVLAALKRYLRLFRNGKFILANSSMCLLGAPMLGYVGIASGVYMDQYGLSESSFAILFAAAPLLSMSGAYACTRLLQHFSDKQLIFGSLIGGLVAGVFLLLLGNVHFLFFMVGAACFSFFAGISRPLSNHVILEQVTEDIGAASSTIIFTSFMAGAMCMAIVTAGWSNPVMVYSLCILGMFGSILMVWPLLMRRLRF